MISDKIQLKNGRWWFDGRKVQDLNMDEFHKVDDYFRNHKNTIKVFQLLDKQNEKIDSKISKPKII